MNNRKVLYFTLTASFLLEIFMLRYVGIFPDLLVIIVVYTAIFSELVVCQEAALVAGLLRSVFSSYPFPVDIITFQVMAFFAHMLSRLLEGQRALVSMLITGASLALVGWLQLMYQYSALGTSPDVASAMTGNLGAILVTAALALPVFKFLKRNTLTE